MSLKADNKILLTWEQSQSVPLDGFYQVYGGIGSVSYSAPIGGRVPAWPDPTIKSGLGLGTLGGGSLGIGDAGALTLGSGVLGAGLLGVGGSTLQLHLDNIADGAWKFAICAGDGAGNVSTPADVEISLSLAGTPLPPGMPTVTQDEETLVVSLRWPLSPNDR